MRRPSLNPSTAPDKSTVASSTGEVNPGRQPEMPAPLENQVLVRRLMHLAMAILVLSVLGMIGFSLVTGCTLFDAWFLTVITISTVGYGETVELGQSGRLFAGSLIVVSYFFMAWCTARVTSVLIEGDLTGAVRKRHMENRVRKMKNHIVVCGAGLFARAALENLVASDRNRVVVVSDNTDEVRQLQERFPEISAIEYPPTSDLSLARAGLFNARAVIVATSSDVDNLLISMSCKETNPTIHVYAVSQDGELAGRMDKVGVDEVICPYLLFGSRIGKLLAPAGTGPDQREAGTQFPTGPGTLLGALD